MNFLWRYLAATAVVQLYINGSRTIFAVVLEIMRSIIEYGPSCNNQINTIVRQFLHFCYGVTADNFIQNVLYGLTHTHLLQAHPLQTVIYLASALNHKRLLGQQFFARTVSA